MGETGLNNVPNEALYQAEPRPVMIDDTNPMQWREWQDNSLGCFLPKKNSVGLRGMLLQRAGAALHDLQMPEVQTSEHSGEMTQRFISFVMMQAQQAGLFLGQIPHPQTGKAEKNLEAARLFIDQLEMIREKTRNNLSTEESEILSGVLSDLQMAFVKVRSEGDSPPQVPAESAASQKPSVDQGAGTMPQTPAETSSPPTSESPLPADSVAKEEDGGSRKKFTKSYGS